MIDRFYRLPDGTRVVAIDYAPGRLRFDTDDGQPLLLQGEPNGPLLQLTYDPQSAGYRCAPCDLTLEDLRLIEGQEP